MTQSLDELAERLRGWAKAVYAEHDDPGLVKILIEAADALSRLQPGKGEEDGASAREEWRCFHCGETFTDRNEAQAHFGSSEITDLTGCRLNGLEGGILKLYREAEEELRRFRQEDNASFREFYALGADHAVALRREEEKGYARGLADGRLYPASEASGPSPPHTGGENG